MVWHGGPAATHLTPPHDITGKPSGPHLPQGEGAERLHKIMDRAAAILREHPVNHARIAAGKTAATSVWFWGQGRASRGADAEGAFRRRGFGHLGGRPGQRVGQARRAWSGMTVPGATGFLDTDYAAKARYGLKSLERRDFLLLHIEAPDEAGHMGRADLKRDAIQRIDELIIGPLLRDLPTLGDFRLLLMPDHATPCKLKTHSNEPVPFAMLGASSSKGAVARRYTEAEAARTGVAVTDGYRLIESLLGTR